MRQIKSPPVDSVLLKLANVLGAGSPSKVAKPNPNFVWLPPHPTVGSQGRATWLGLGLIALITMLVMRLFDVQVVRGETFLHQAEANRFFTQRLAADRGVILDRYGQPMVWNSRQYWHVDNHDAVHPTRQVISREAALPLLATQAAQVEFTQHREYRFPESLALTLGYIGPVNAEELVADASLHIQSQVGRIGLERRFDQQLRGRDGAAVYEVNALGQKQRLVKEEAPLHGQALPTTIDPFLSELAYQALGDSKGSVVISDASSGAVLALVSKPSFSANLFSELATDPTSTLERSNAIKAAFEDPRQLFFHRAIGGVYPPGSVFKIITALAGLETESLNADTTVVDEGILRVGEYEYRNWYFTQYGRTEGAISLARALARSNDIYFYKAAEWIGPTRLAEWSRRFGLGKKPGTELSGEAAGLVPDPDWKVAQLGEPWYLGNTYHFGIGQGDVLVSPMQIATLVQAVANQGNWCQPHLADQTTPNCGNLGVNQANVDIVMNGLITACSPGGTAFPFFPRNQAILATQSTLDAQLTAGAVACKTGTAEFGARDEQGYRNTHGWFVAIVEPQLPALASSADQKLDTAWRAGQLDYSVWQQLVAQRGFPKRIVMTVLTESDETFRHKEGSREAAPVAKKILDWIEGKSDALTTEANQSVASGSATVDVSIGE